ncbi:MAG TPA: glycosyltransferase, partial [Candidatus Omnitrophota bacterium]|nr:glycosyltransferase [Candidatus Omnitrophota bacterium]
MKILQMLPALRSGGVETGTVDVARALKKMGHEVFVMSSGGGMVKELVKAGIPHITLPVHRKALTSLLLVKTVRDFIVRNRIDIVHARSRVPAWIGFLAARRTGAVFVTTCHGYYSTHAMSRVMGWGKEVIVISKIIGKHMQEDFGVPPER